MTSIDERLLESKMTQIEQARSWSPRVISKFETLIRSGDEVIVHRANPLAFARDRGVAEPELESFGKLRAPKSHFVCGLCDIDGQTELDDFIEVSCSVSPQV